MSNSANKFTPEDEVEASSPVKPERNLLAAVLARASVTHSAQRTASGTLCVAHGSGYSAGLRPSVPLVLPGLLCT